MSYSKNKICLHDFRDLEEVNMADKIIMRLLAGAKCKFKVNWCFVDCSFPQQKELSMQPFKYKGPIIDNECGKKYGFEEIFLAGIAASSSSGAFSFIIINICSCLVHSQATKNVSTQDFP